MSCKSISVAKKNYQRDVYRLMAVYAVLLLCSMWFVRHRASQHFVLYFWSVLPALPIVAMIGRMARYLKHETDEYQRMLTMQAILVGTGVLLAMLVMNDFVRAFANGNAWPPFACFVTFCFAIGITQLIQNLRNRVSEDE